jgi:hypothetical protein
MSTLTLTKYEMPSASLGKLNPLPDLRKIADQHASIPVDETTITKEEAQYMGWERVNGILPYLLQDGYNRKKKLRAWKAAVLENDFIRATFLPELGGRLWSLIDKTTDRELLHRNPVFQPCNLALRNAWISGGVEWNIGLIGHSPFTVDRMFTEELTMNDGTPVLRMYQYERIRRLIFRIEAILPEDSKYLYIRVRIDNTSDQDTAVYWWSNIAVDEREDVRVLVPADKSYRWGYGGKLTKVPIPYMTVQADQLRGGAGKTGTFHWDISRTTQLPQAMDFFFDIPKGQRKWISAVDGDGYGLVQTSTDVLQGRKLFVWGMGAGGRNWQTFLSQPGSAYIELQAGLARTQLEHLPMKGGAVISWLEAYGPIAAKADIVHGRDWISSRVGAWWDSVLSSIAVKDKGFDVEYIPLMPFVSSNNNPFVYLKDLPGYGGYMITKDCKHPELAMKTIDWGYSVEGTIQNYYGESSLEGGDYYRKATPLEGLTLPEYQMEYTEKGQAAQNEEPLLWAKMGWNLEFTTKVLLGNADAVAQEFYQAFGVDKCGLGADVQYNLKGLKDAEFTYGIPAINFVSPTSEQARKWEDFSDLWIYMDEQISKFITGVEPISNWDSFVAQCEKMGIKEATEIRQEQYDAYKKIMDNLK